MIVSVSTLPMGGRQELYEVKRCLIEKYTNNSAWGKITSAFRHGKIAPLCSLHLHAWSQGVGFWTNKVINIAFQKISNVLVPLLYM